MKSRDLEPRLLYPPKISFRIKGRIKSFLDRKNLKEFIITKPLYEMLKDLFKKKKMIKTMNNKIAKNTNLSIIESKKKLSKQEETESWIQKGEMGRVVGKW